MWEWLRDEANLRALKIVGAVISASIVGVWTVYTYWLPISDSQKMEDALRQLRMAATGAKVHKLVASGNACELRFVESGSGREVVVDVRESDLFHQADNPRVWVFSNPRQEIEVNSRFSHDAAIAYAELKELCLK